MTNAQMLLPCLIQLCITEDVFISEVFLSLSLLLPQAWKEPQLWLQAFTTTIHASVQEGQTASLNAIPAQSFSCWQHPCWSTILQFNSASQHPLQTMPAYWGQPLESTFSLLGWAMCFLKQRHVAFSFPRRRLWDTQWEMTKCGLKSKINNMNGSFFIQHSVKATLLLFSQNWNELYTSTHEGILSQVFRNPTGSYFCVNMQVSDLCVSWVPKLGMFRLIPWKLH